ncbi:MAG TPA: histidinol dehydrogenase [Solirubrobacteraceae bacterium]|nr:histidinol dehydrogenase [Solirubrobacteraceae bacterium]
MAARTRLRLDDPAAAGKVAGAIRALVPPPAAITTEVARIVEAVRDDGDVALTEFAHRLDGVDGPLRVTGAELDAAVAALDPELRSALELAIANVGAVARAGLGSDIDVELPQGQTVRLREVPVRRAAVYVPGGRAPYPSSVVMGAVTARTAGVDEVVVCAPGGHPSILAACALCGVREVYRAGGAHVVAALAYGTATVPRVDVVVGPGNTWVQEAKRLVSGSVGIDGFAGPSDVLVLASEGADAALVAIDLLAQAEHGEGSIAVAVTEDAALLEDIDAHVADAAETGAAIALVGVPDAATALALAEALAPEHLELQGAAAEALAPDVRSAGCLFVGSASATAFGDYVAGSNHTLPTGGAARFASGLNVRHFRRRMSEVRIGAAAGALAPAGAAIARAEGFDLHAASMEVRENGRP